MRDIGALWREEELAELFFIEVKNRYKVVDSDNQLPAQKRNTLAEAINGAAEEILQKRKIRAKKIYDD